MAAQNMTGLGAVWVTVNNQRERLSSFDVKRNCVNIRNCIDIRNCVNSTNCVYSRNCVKSRNCVDRALIVFILECPYDVCNNNALLVV